MLRCIMHRPSTLNLYALYFSHPLKRTNPHLVRFISNVFIYELVYCINGVEDHGALYLACNFILFVYQTLGIVCDFWVY